MSESMTLNKIVCTGQYSTPDSKQFLFITFLSIITNKRDIQVGQNRWDTLYMCVRVCIFRSRVKRTHMFNRHLLKKRYELLFQSNNGYILYHLFLLFL